MPCLWTWCQLDRARAQGLRTNEKTAGGRAGGRRGAQRRVSSRGVGGWVVGGVCVCGGGGAGQRLQRCRQGGTWVSRQGATWVSRQGATWVSRQGAERKACTAATATEAPKMRWWVWRWWAAGDCGRR